MINNFFVLFYFFFHSHFYLHNLCLVDKQAFLKLIIYKKYSNVIQFYKFLSIDDQFEAHKYVVSRILRVHESLGHEPGNKNLQNKQGTGGGVPAGSLMLKLVKEIESILTINLADVYFTYLFLSITFLIYEEGW